MTYVQIQVLRTDSGKDGHVQIHFENLPKFSLLRSFVKTSIRSLALDVVGGIGDINASNVARSSDTHTRNQSFATAVFSGGKPANFVTDRTVRKAGGNPLRDKHGFDKWRSRWLQCLSFHHRLDRRCGPFGRACSIQRSIRAPPFGRLCAFVCVRNLRILPKKIRSIPSQFHHRSSLLQR